MPNASSTIQIVKALGEEPAFKAGDRVRISMRYLKQQHTSVTIDDGSMGIWIKIKKSPTSRILKDLLEITRAKGWCQAWFGYEFSNEPHLQPDAVKSVYFYLSSEARQKLLWRKMLKKFPLATKLPKQRDDYIVIVPSNNREESDVDSFLRIFEFALSRKEHLNPRQL